MGMVRVVLTAGFLAVFHWRVCVMEVQGDGRKNCGYYEVGH
jgi:hypothetical protein